MGAPIASRTSLHLHTVSLPSTYTRFLSPPQVKEARAALEEVEIDKKLASIDMRREAVTLAEQNGESGGGRREGGREGGRE